MNFIYVEQIPYKSKIFVPTKVPKKKKILKTLERL